jgi:hypothetical protein
LGLDSETFEWDNEMLFHFTLLELAKPIWYGVCNRLWQLSLSWLTRGMHGHSVHLFLNDTECWCCLEHLAHCDLLIQWTWLLLFSVPNGLCSCAASYVSAVFCACLFCWVAAVLCVCWIFLCALDTWFLPTMFLTASDSLDVSVPVSSS